MNQVKLLHQMFTAIYAALNDTNILRQLSKLGFDAKTIREGEKLANQFQDLIREQEAAHRHTKTATRNLQTARHNLHQTYRNHVALARLIFQNQPEAMAELGLNGKRKNRIENWLKQCQDFYYYAEKHAITLEKYNISQAEITEMKTLLSEVTSLYALQKQASGRAQVLTQQKQEMGSLLEQWYRKYIKVARLALDSEPQQLEALGIVVKA